MRMDKTLSIAALLAGSMLPGGLAVTANAQERGTPNALNGR